MAVKYVSDFSFPKSPPRPTVAGYARGGHVTTPQRYAKGGTAGCYAKGGSADIKSGVGKGGDVRSKGAGTGYSGEHIKMISDVQRERGSRTEKSSGVQKP